jgi:hypothetical protein
MLHTYALMSARDGEPAGLAECADLPGKIESPSFPDPNPGF